MLAGEVLSLPISPDLTQEEVEKMCGLLRGFPRKFNS
jgi:dTDP-4-amino-4,6-dideoxygalactose transaminase